MKKIVLILIIGFNVLFASAQILSYNIYERSDRVDVMITFDRPYKGTIKQSNQNSKIILKLTNSKIESIKRKKVLSSFLKSIIIMPVGDTTQIEAYVPKSVHVKASKTSDSYGLRLRFSKQIPPKKMYTRKQSNALSALPTKKDEDISTSYYIVITILIIGIVILFIIKKRFTPKEQKQTQPSMWGFKHQAKPSTTKQDAKANPNEVSIRFQKAINDKSSVVMLDFMEQSYLVLMGNNNILLDKFVDNKPTTQAEFEQILKERNEQLESYLNANEKIVYTAPKTEQSLKSYKERAANIAYEAN